MRVGWSPAERVVAPRAACARARRAGATDTEPANRRGDPHPLDLGRLAGVELEGAATHRLARRVATRNARPAAAARRRRPDAERRVEAALEAAVELGEVLAQAEPRVRMPGSTGSMPRAPRSAGARPRAIAATSCSRWPSLSGSRSDSASSSLPGRAAHARAGPRPSGARREPAGRARRAHRDQPAASSVRSSRLR